MLNLRSIAVWSVVAFVICVAILCPDRARAQKAGDCDASNLVEGAGVEANGRVRGRLERLVDGKLPREGTLWLDNDALRLQDRKGNWVIDLGRPRSIRYLLLQADHNDDYVLEYSVDTVKWQHGWTAPRLPQVGLRTRTKTLESAIVGRYLRLRVADGDESLSVSEIRAYCAAPTPWPPKLRMIPKPGIWQRLKLAYTGFVGSWNVFHTRAWVGVSGALFLCWILVFRRRRNSAEMSRLQNIGMLFLGLAGVYCWFGSANFNNIKGIHIWDTYHHYIGSKYAPELGHQGLYLCTVAADLEEDDEAPRQRTLTREVRDLRTRQIVRGAVLAKDIDSCVPRFTPQRWQAFRQDIRWFRKHMSPSLWARIQVDHGYNATPVWTILGRALASTSPASWTQMRVLCALDYLLLLVMSIVVGRLFGWRSLCVLWLVFGTCYPTRIFLNHGTFLRHTWLLLVVLGVAALKRGRMANAGMALTYATLLRGFPGLLFVGLALKIGQRMLRERRFVIDRSYRRLIASSLVTAIALGGLATVAGGGFKVWSSYLHNAAVYSEMQWDHDIGLKSILSYRQERRVKETYVHGAFNSMTRWAKARNQTFEERRWLFYLLIAAFLLLLERAVRGRDDWLAALFSVGLFPIVTGLGSYYCAFLVIYALLYRESFPIAFGLVLMSAATACMLFVNSAADELALLNSIIIVTYVVVVTAWLGKKKLSDATAQD